MAAWPALILILAISAGTGPNYERAMRRALNLEARGRQARAAEVLAPVAEAYPQDYAAQLQLAWLYFQLGKYDASETYYRRADALAQGTLEPRLGLGWIAVKRGQYAEARAFFRSVLKDEPSSPDALAGWRASYEPPIMRLTPSVGGAIHVGRGHKSRAYALSTGVGLTAVMMDQLYVHGYYRYTNTAVYSDAVTTNATGRRLGYTLPSRPQSGSYAAVGYVGPQAGAVVQAARITGAAGVLPQAVILGASLRLSLHGELTIDMSRSSYADLRVLRVAPAWSLPLGDSWTAQPAFSWQRAGDQSYASAAFSLGMRRSNLSLWAGAKLGREVRPAHLYRDVVYNIPETITHGAWFGVQRLLVLGWRMTAGYQWLRLRGTNAESGSRRDSSLHLLGVSFGRQFGGGDDPPRS